MWYMHGDFGWWMVITWVVMALFWGGLIALAVWFFRRIIRHESDGKASPLDIAKERYARGEITKQQYEKLKKDLM
ncbi:MAG: SHOCT domain-containing protein [Dehalococcoidales bacterium]|nr:SHOCT domain-containing protein [Dehalococcoidales bacterium]